MTRLRVAVVVDDTGARTGRPASLLAAALGARHDTRLVRVRRATRHDDQAPPSRLVAHDGVRWTRDDDAAAREALAELDADVVVTTSPETLAAAAQLVPPGPALVHHHHRADPSSGRGDLLLRAFGARADAVTVLDDHAAVHVRSLLGSATPPVTVVPHAIATGWRPRPAPHTDPATGLLLAVAPLEADQQLPQLLQAFAPLASDRPGWRLRVVGGGSRRRELLGTARRLGLHDQVELAPRSRDLAAEWARATLGVSTARVTPWGAPAADALRAGVPFLAYDVPGGTRRLVRPGVTGELAADGSPASLAAALQRLADDPDRHAALAEGACAHGHHLVETCTDGWDAVLRQVGGDDLPATGPGSAAGDVPMTTPPSALFVPPLQARRAALDLVVDVVAGTARDWFVLPRPFPEPVRVVVPEEHRTAVLEALARADAPSWMGGRLPSTGARPEVRDTLARTAAHALGGAVGVIAIGPAAGADAPAGTDDGGTVLVEIWPRDRRGGLVAVARNGLLRSLPPGSPVTTVAVDGREVPVPEPFQHPTTWDFTEPVDIVSTWVDGGDPVWDAARRARLRAAGTTDRRASGRARFHSRDELRYSLRSVHLFAPWVRTIHLVTAGQRPAWLADHPRVRLVDHRDLLPAGALPTFSSHAIETRLHRVPGLSEHFIYLNDDVLLGRPLGVRSFFGPGGTAATFAGREPLGVPGGDEAPYLGAAFTNRRLLLDAFGTAAVRFFAHAPHPHRVSVLEEVAERFGPEVDRTTLTPFRSAEDVSMLSSLAQQYGLRTGRAHPAELAVAHVDLTRATLARELRALGDRRHADVICLADGHDWAFEPGVAEAELAAFLESYYPVAAPWERG